MKKQLADSIFEHTVAAGSAVEKIIERCHQELEKDDHERIFVIKSCGKIFSEIKEIEDYLAENFPDLASKYKPHSYSGS